ncbi:MAG: hypothetical protein ACI8RZ_001264, partial [Myxococcota bacterium]
PFWRTVCVKGCLREAGGLGVKPPFQTKSHQSGRILSGPVTGAQNVPRLNELQFCKGSTRSTLCSRFSSRSNTVYISTCKQSYRRSLLRFSAARCPMRPPAIPLWSNRCGAIPVRWIQAAKKSAGEPRDGRWRPCDGPPEQHDHVRHPTHSHQLPLSTHRIGHLADRPGDQPDSSATGRARTRWTGQPLWSNTSRPNTRYSRSYEVIPRSSYPGGFLLCLRSWAFF